MAVAGRKPTPEGQKKINNHPTMEWTEVEDVPFDGPWPELPDTYSDAAGEPEKDERWTSSTRRWFNVMKRMPHAVLWHEAEWEFLLLTAMVHHRFVRGNTGAAGELRRREKDMGNTADARRDLRIKYVPKATEKPVAVVRSIDSVRDL